MSATTTLMTSSAVPHDPQHVPDSPLAPRPSTPPTTTSPAQPLPSPTSPPAPNVQDHPVTQEPAEKGRPEDGGSSPMELEDSLDDPDMSNDATMSDFAHDIDSDVDYLAEDLMNDLRRVKVYELVNQTWKDLGTAFCTGDYDEAAGAQLVAKTEDTKEVVLQISIRSEEVYQRQADTLIVWQEPDGKDYALSFQDLEGCSEVWDFIQEVRKHLKSLEDPGSSSPYPEYLPASSVHVGQLPAPTLANIRDIERSLKTVVRSAPTRERIAENIVSTDFVRELVKLMRDAEDLESLPDLHALCNLMQTILMLNDQSIYEYVLRDDVFVDMVGILEYDPDFPMHKACYREFLKDNMHYREIISFREPAIRVKVHQTYRLQYLKDVVLARVLDDPTFNILNSFIIFNQIDIVNYIQNEEYFLNELFHIFQPQVPSAYPSNGSEASVNTVEADQGQRKEETDERKAAALLLLHQFCSMGKNVQLPMRIPLFRSLVDRGVLHPINWALAHTDVKIRSIGGEILTVTLDHDAGGVRGHILRQYDQGLSPTLLYRMSTMLARPLELGFRTQLAESYRTLMDVPGADHTNVSASSLNTIISHSPDSPPPSNTGPHPVSPPSTSSFLNGLHQFLKNSFSPSSSPPTSPPPPDNQPSSPEPPSTLPPQQLPGIKVVPKKEDAQSEKFVDYFYKNCAEELFKPFSGVVDHKEVKDEDVPLRLGREQSDPFLYLCDLLSGFLLQHSYQSHFFVLSSNVSAKVATLLYAREKHLRLSALRFFRTCLRLNNNNLLNHLKKHQVFLPILKLTLRESKRDNLLSSCCQEMFEAVRRENYRDLIDHIVTNYEPLIKELSESAIMGQRFIGLIRRWEINNEPPPRVEPLVAPQPRKWGQVRLADAEDEYFNGGSDDDAPISPTAPRGRTQRSMPLRRGGGKRPSRPTNVSLPKPFPIGGIALVEYQEEDEPAIGPTSGAPHFQDSPRPKRLRRDIGHKNEVTRTTSSINLAELSGSTPPSSGSQGQAGGLTRTKSVADLSPMTMEEDDDLSGLPVPLSYKRRREEDEEEGLERLAKRPALAGKEKEKGRDRSLERVGPKARAVSPAPSRSAADEVEGNGTGTGTGTGRTAGPGTHSQRLRLKVRLGGKGAGPPPQGSPPDTSVKVGDKG